MKKVQIKASRIAKLCVELGEGQYQLLKKLIGLNLRHVTGRNLSFERKEKETELCLTVLMSFISDFRFNLGITVAYHDNSNRSMRCFFRLDSDNFPQLVGNLYAVSVFLGTALENCRALEMEKCPVCQELIYENKKKWSY